MLKRETRRMSPRGRSPCGGTLVGAPLWGRVISCVCTLAASCEVLPPPEAKLLRLCLCCGRPVRLTRALPDERDTAVCLEIESRSVSLPVVVGAVRSLNVVYSK